MQGREAPVDAGGGHGAQAVFSWGMEQFRKRSAELRSRQTRAEARLWSALRNRRLAEWKFRRQHPIDRYVVDFVTIGGKLIVEVDGVTHVTGEERAKDDERTRILESLGFRVVRVSNTDVYENLDGVLAMIFEELTLSRR
ncbi:endonuclease domain-containing protein [Microbaculum marinum]|uniref:Endonuclease domain-containing protein n=1 Tax=Microbaculum marinum TaxID=1764581 RepID=A0AAW9RR13_9HYPH